MCKGSEMMKVLFVGAECTPFIKTGGLADVMGALPKSIGNVDVILPAYRGVLEKLNTEDIKVFHVRELNKKAEVHLYHIGATSYYFVKQDYYYDRDQIYGEPDDAERFAFFNLVVKKFALKRNYDIVHCHDWHTGMLPYLLKDKIKTVYTIHNLAYQGLFPKDTADLFELEDERFYIWDQFNYMKIGIEFADVVTTVSETYAKEITHKALGCGLDDLLRTRRKSLVGIVNGVDYNEFNPETDPNLKFNYGVDTYDLKKVNKRFLQNELGLKPVDKMVVGIVTRLAEQKGLDLLVGILDKMLTYDIQFVLLGSGDPQYEQALEKYIANNDVSINIGYSEELARKIYAGCDLFLVPSRFEPCGLSQLISYKYGTLPLVRQTGGLADTVKDIKDGGVGFVFKKYTRKALLDKFVEAYNSYQKGWDKYIQKAMRLDFSFDKKAEEYRELYERVMK